MLSISQLSDLCAKTSRTWNCIRESTASHLREMLHSLSAEITFGLLGPVLGSSAQDRHGCTGESPLKRHKDYDGYKASVIQTSI